MAHDHFLVDLFLRVHHQEEENLRRILDGWLHVGNAPKSSQQPGSGPKNRKQPGSGPKNRKQPGSGPENRKQPGSRPKNCKQPGSGPEYPGVAPGFRHRPISGRSFGLKTARGGTQEPVMKEPSETYFRFVCFGCSNSQPSRAPFETAARMHTVHRYT